MMKCAAFVFLLCALFPRTGLAAVQNGKGKVKAVASVKGADLDNVAANVASLKK